MSLPPPEQRETYCHECLTENPRTRTTCVACGARLRHPRDFAQDLKDMTPTVNVTTFGVVGAMLAVAVYGLAIAVLMPFWLKEHGLLFVAGALVALASGRGLGRFVARQLNDSTVTGVR